MNLRHLSFPQAPLIKTPPPGPKSRELLDFQAEYEGSAVSYPRGLPMALQRGRGATVEDVDGNIYIDFFGGAAVLNVGHSHPDVVAAALAQVSELTHSLDVPNPARRALVERLLSLLPDPLHKVFFGGPTGSDAVESAVKLAKFNTKRYPLIAFSGGYHGMSAGALSLCSGLSFKEDFLPLIAEVHFCPYAYCYRCPFQKKPESCNLECAHYLEVVLTDPHSGVGRPAAIIVEAIQGEGGSVVPPEDFIAFIRELCHKLEIILIIDEIQTGFGRTGKMFAFQHSGIIPDIVTFSKALGGLGFPISCIAYRKELDTLPPGKHIGTFRGNVVAYAAGRAALDFITDKNLPGHAQQLGGRVIEELKSLEKDSKSVGDIRGAGLMLGVEFVLDRSSKKPAPEVARKVRSLCHKRGLLIEIGGHYFNVARFLPPLVLTEDLADEGVRIFKEAVKEAEDSL
ncbi:MAG: aspartate aminotransferase family protein [Candidatus Aminicenantes bacterium]|nr:aspartate aminotransferase family protein [Candidatus Aminicenantes bacterium]